MSEREPGGMFEVRGDDGPQSCGQCECCAAWRIALDAAEQENARLRAALAASEADLKGQIDALAKVLLEEFGGPTRSEGACEMAVRVLREQRAAREEAEKLAKALTKIRDDEGACNCTHDDEKCCAKVDYFCSTCIAAAALAAWKEGR